MQRKNRSESQLSIDVAEGQKAAGPKKMGWPKKEDAEKSGNGLGIQTGDTRDEAAENFGITGRTVSEAANALGKAASNSSRP